MVAVVVVVVVLVVVVVTRYRLLFPWGMVWSRYTVSPCVSACACEVNIMPVSELLVHPDVICGASYVVFKFTLVGKLLASLLSSSSSSTRGNKGRTLEYLWELFRLACLV